MAKVTCQVTPAQFVARSDTTRKYHRDNVRCLEVIREGAFHRGQPMGGSDVPPNQLVGTVPVVPFIHEFHAAAYFICREDHATASCSGTKVWQGASIRVVLVSLSGSIFSEQTRQQG